MGNPALNIGSDSDCPLTFVAGLLDAENPQLSLSLSLDDCLDFRNLSCLLNLELEHSVTEGTGRAVQWSWVFSCHCCSRPSLAPGGAKLGCSEGV